MDFSESPDPQQQQQQQQSPQLQQQQPSSQQQLFGQQSDNNFGVLNNMMMNTTIRRDPQELDIDSALLQQFSCLGTTDHEDLINELQTIMNNCVNKETARFFLEMSNWNISTAICCYMDFCNYQNLPSMKIIETSRPSEFSQAWKLQNDGDENWPSGCYLMSPSQTKKLEVPSIRPGETCDIVADIPPASPAIYWRLCTPHGWYFGETIWMIPSGSEDSSSDLAQRMAQLRTSSASSTTTMTEENSPQVNVMIVLKMD